MMEELSDKVKEIESNIVVLFQAYNNVMQKLNVINETLSNPTESHDVTFITKVIVRNKTELDSLKQNKTNLLKELDEWKSMNKYIETLQNELKKTTSKITISILQEKLDDTIASFRTKRLDLDIIISIEENDRLIVANESKQKILDLLS
jgi:hypothetical protein